MRSNSSQRLISWLPVGLFVTLVVATGVTLLSLILWLHRITACSLWLDTDVVLLTVWLIGCTLLLAEGGVGWLLLRLPSRRRSIRSGANPQGGAE